MIEDDLIDDLTEGCSACISFGPFPCSCTGSSWRVVDLRRMLFLRELKEGKDRRLTDREIELRRVELILRGAGISTDTGALVVSTLV
jgi:hypothetical protein